jgi:hypothetical protein
MKIGFAKEIITPSLDRAVYLAGFGQNRRAETVHDDLTVRAISISDSFRTVVLCSLDLIGFFRRDVYEVIETLKVSETFRVLSPNVIISSVHPHHGPDTMGMWGPNDKTSGVDPVYFAELKNKIVATILASLENMQPIGGIKVASMHFSGLAKNARNPEVVDDELVLAQFVGRDNISPLLTIANFPCHPEVLWEHNPHITADYPGYLRKEVERQTSAPCVFFSADLGGMMTPDVKDHSFEEAHFMGKALAEQGLLVLANAPILHEPLTISLQKKEFKIKLTNILFKFAIQRKIFPDIRDEKGFIHSEVNLLKIGPLWLATIPGELLPKLGMALKANMRTAGAGSAGVIGLANDELGYILPKEEFRYPINPLKPGKHYEETMSVSKEIGPVVVNAVRELIKNN